MKLKVELPSLDSLSWYLAFKAAFMSFLESRRIVMAFISDDGGVLVSDKLAREGGAGCMSVGFSNVE